MNNEALMLTNSYWDILKSLSDEVKLHLATRLTASIVKSKDSEIKHTEKMLEKFFGTWDDTRSTDDIVNDIKSHSSSKTPVEL